VKMSDPSATIEFPVSLSATRQELRRLLPDRWADHSDMIGELLHRPCSFVRIEYAKLRVHSRGAHELVSGEGGEWR
jgi:hypothetical protein